MIDAVRPLARSLAETITEGVLAVLCAVATLVVLLAFEPDEWALVGFLPGACVSFGAFLLLERRLPRRGAFTPQAGAPGDTRRERPAATVRRILFGRDAWFIAIIPLAYLATLGDNIATLVPGAIVGAIAGAGLYGLRDAIRLARWERAHDRILLHEALKVPLSAKPLWQRAVYSEPRCGAVNS